MEHIGRPWQIHYFYLDKRKWKEKREKEGKEKEIGDVGEEVEKNLHTSLIAHLSPKVVLLDLSSIIKVEQSRVSCQKV